MNGVHYAGYSTMCTVMIHVLPVKPEFAVPQGRNRNAGRNLETLAVHILRTTELCFFQCLRKAKPYCRYFLVWVQTTIRKTNPQ